ncbi:TetR family transcriptional regulator [Nocardioides sp. YIM 152588]|uniref:TetR/AcrR family transcriptional regulator n=1 Tax=Nocardioides sp. YIM 152588 TaxID=3158259 RepID=UPI0032E42038
MAEDSTASRAGRRPGRAETSARILAAARGLFAERGFAGTTIRAVAAEAAVDPALVHHYFGTKEQLFRAAVDFPFDPEQVLGALTSDADGEPAALLARTVLRLWDSPETGAALAGFLRQVVADPAATDLVREYAGTNLFRVVARALLEDPDAPDADLRVALVASQILGLALLRRVIGVEPLASASADRLARLVTPTLTRYLRDDLASD